MIQNVRNKKVFIPKLSHNWGLLWLFTSIKSINQTKIFVCICKWILTYKRNNRMQIIINIKNTLTRNRSNKFTGKKKKKNLRIKIWVRWVGTWEYWSTWLDLGLRLLWPIIKTTGSCSISMAWLLITSTKDQ